MAVDRQVVLRFGGGPAAASGSDLSAVCGDGSVLWVAGDELTELHRLTVQADGSYGDLRTFPLADLVDLPEEADEEVDVEGMDRAGDTLWLVGSHSRTRKEPDPGDDDRDVLKKLAKVREHPNRSVLVRIPLVRDGGDSRPVRSADGDRRTAAVLDGDLRAALASDA